jgi:hypothetical protein
VSGWARREGDEISRKSEKKKLTYIDYLLSTNDPALRWVGGTTKKSISEKRNEKITTNIFSFLPHSKEGA